MDFLQNKINPEYNSKQFKRNNGKDSFWENGQYPWHFSDLNLLLLTSAKSLYIRSILITIFRQKVRLRNRRRHIFYWTKTIGIGWDVWDIAWVRRLFQNTFLYERERQKKML